MNEIPETQSNRKMAAMMNDLAISEQMLDQYQKELIKYQSDPDGEAYANAVGWITHYTEEIQRLFLEISMLEEEILGVEQPKTEKDDDTRDQIRTTHPDIRKILESFTPPDAPLE